MTKSKTRLFSCLAVSILILALIPFIRPQVAHANNLSVPSQFGSIQAAINAAGNGDTILVAPGTYREYITIDGKYVTLKATSNDPNATIIASDPGRTPVMIQHVPYRAGVARAKIQGFKIIYGSAPDGQGGGITVANNADPIIANNRIESNHSTDGGGILVYNSSNPSILFNAINSNSVTYFGAGIFAVLNSSPIIYGNTITANRASGGQVTNGGASGGGIYLENNTSNSSAYSNPIVSNNTIDSNSAEFAGGGIMLRTGVNAIIEENTITNNQAAYGGGVHIETTGSSPKVVNNVLHDNTAAYNSSFSGSGFGGAISVYDSSKPNISSNTVYSNHATYGGGGISLAEGSNSFISANNINNNTVTNTNSTYSGGGIYIANAQLNMQNNVLYRNGAVLGGGLAVLDNGKVSAVNNTFANNSASYTGSAGGGGVFVRNQSGVTASFTNNIFSLNSNYQVFEEARKATYTNNLLTNDGKGMYFNYSTNGITSINSFNGNGNINSPTNNVGSDPLFGSAARDDYTIGAGSAAIDAGTSANAPSQDIVKAARPSGAADDIGAYERTGQTVFQAPVYRFWSSLSNDHFYTMSHDEKNYLLANYAPAEWQYEYQAFDAFTNATNGTAPICRFNSQAYGGHFYTADPNECTYVQNNYPTNVWQYEGTAFNAFTNSYNGSFSTNVVYRFWSPVYHQHFYTTSSAEKDYLIANSGNTWTYEGQQFKVPS